MNGLFKNLTFPAAEINGARSAIDSLPGIVDALGKLPAILRAMPPAPVVTGAVSRFIANAIASELEHRGPSGRLSDLCAAHGLDNSVARELFDALVDEVRA